MKCAVIWKLFGSCMLLAAVTGWARAGDPVLPAEFYLNRQTAMPQYPDDNARAENGAAPGYVDQNNDSSEPSDLTLANFFSAGWDEAWTQRSHVDRAPRLALLRVQTNFLEREVRADYAFTNNVSSRKIEDSHFADALLAYGLNRRLMLAVQTSYEWDEARDGFADRNGSTGTVVARFQLIDTYDSSYALNFRVTPPNKGIGQDQTNLFYNLAGFEDLTRRLGLYRVGLYYHLGVETLLGPAEPGIKRNDANYDVTVAKTLTDPDVPLIGDLTAFVETLGITNLDGDRPGRTELTVTPGIRFNLGRGHWLMGGIDLPITGPRPFDAIYRLTYIKPF